MGLRRSLARGLDRAESEILSQVFIGSVKAVRASARRYQECDLARRSMLAGLRRSLARGLDRGESEILSQVFIGSVKAVRASARRYQECSLAGRSMLAGLRRSLASTLVPDQSGGLALVTATHALLSSDVTSRLGLHQAPLHAEHRPVRACRKTGSGWHGRGLPRPR